MTDMSNVTLRVFLERLYFYCSSLITQRPKLQLLKVLECFERAQRARSLHYTPLSNMLTQRWETAQWLQCLPYKSEDWSLDPQNT